MSKIVSIATGVPSFKHRQEALFNFAEKVYCKDETEIRKLKFLYGHSGIETRYSVVPDYSVPANERTLFPPSADLEPFPCIEERMKIFHEHAAALSAKTMEDCIKGKISKDEITHLITVSCTGMSAPGIDLQVMELLELPQNIVRTSVNFMGCYAAVHALKLANAFCGSEENANVIVVCTELCTLHFQKEPSADNMTSSLLFADGCAAMLVQNTNSKEKGILVNNFFSNVSFKGKQDMAWELSSKGFLMTLTGYVPDLIKEDFKGLVDKALDKTGKKIADITHWCIHPGGKKILESIAASVGINNEPLKYSYDVLRDYGNMSSPTILFVLKKILDEFQQTAPAENNMIFGAAFGPGLTMETFTASVMVNLKKRSYKKELLDADNIPFEDIKQNMRELNTVNTLLGGHKITLAGIKAFGAYENISVCEIGCGGGDNLNAIDKFCKKNNINAVFTGIDIKKECLDFAKQQYSSLNATWISSDYAKADLSKNKPDIIFSSLFCHHFIENDLIIMLRWMKENSNKGFFINDLERNPLAYYSIKFITGIFSRSYLVKNDAPLSVARGFKKKEWKNILGQAGIKNYSIKWKWAFRYLIVYKHDQ